MERTFWYRDAVFYQIWPRSFKDSDGDGVGDLMGIYEKLDYIKSLHVDAIWFSPLYPSPNADYGYDVADYMDISAEYGGMTAFKKVLDGAHRRGMRWFIWRIRKYNFFRNSAVFYIKFFIINSSI